MVDAPLLLTGQQPRDDVWGDVHGHENPRSSNHVSVEGESMSVRTVGRIVASSLRVTNAHSDYLVHLQGRRSAALLRHARSASPYFRRLLRDHPDEIPSWTDVPPTTKATLMANFDDWVTDPRLRRDRLEREFLSRPELLGHAYLHRYRVFTTSGTTGSPAVIVHDPPSWMVFQLVARLRSERQVLRHSAIGQVLRHDFRSAVLFATGGHYGGVGVAAYVQTLHPMLSRRVRIVSVLRPIAEQVRELNTYQPTFISGYPSALLALAREQREGRLAIDPLLMLCAGEYLGETQRAELEDAFGCHLLQGYAASEVPALALECDEHRFHVNADWYLLEPVDAHLDPVPAGVTSDTCLVTNLANFVQPIVRYNLGDRIRMYADPCPCGSLLPSVEVEGRTNDLVRLQSAGSALVEIVPLALGSVIEEIPGVHRFQVINPDPQQLKVRFDESPHGDREQIWETLRGRLHTFLDEHHAQGVSITLDEQRPEAEATGGKLRQVLR